MADFLDRPAFEMSKHKRGSFHRGQLFQHGFDFLLNFQMKDLVIRRWRV